MLPGELNVSGKYFNSGLLYSIAKSACERLATDSRTSAGGQSDAYVSIIFSALSLQALINEMPDLLSMLPESTRHDPPQIREFIRLAAEIEAGRGSIEHKYKNAMQILTGQPVDVGAQPFQDFSLLFRAHNALVHAKPASFQLETGPDGSLIFESVQRIVRDFGAKHIIDSANDPQHPWFYRIGTFKAAQWSCNTAVAVAAALSRAVPDCACKKNFLLHCSSYKLIE
ncbi:hypothetical protein W02_01810 [Nitrospira sp. KM1]|uniref:hypothetical protein n=1 Tax=Nitrospira sp. KM1 TaxID=1936990 RepID=UPI0013A7AD6E|nr:hypothetical protein [Nitrospira sp. KM1]BCA53041.1 hypothetical protein W02_01810 [Nitrospira sp. KM1]